MRHRATAWIRAERRKARALCLIGWILIAAGLVGFGVSSDSLSRIQRTGVRTSATVVGLHLYGGGRDFAWIEVGYADLDGREREAKIWISETATYQLGERVEIAYSRTDPSKAVFARGYADIGPIGVLFFLPLLIGLGMALGGALGAHRMTRGLKLVRRNQGWSTTASLQRWGRRSGRLWLWNRSGQRLVMSAAAWGHLDGEIPVVVFGEIRRRRILVVAAADQASFRVGRVYRPTRAVIRQAPA